MNDRTIVGRALGYALCGALAFAAAASAADTAEHTLKNGLRIIVKEDHRAPVVVSMLWYRAGSMDEMNGTTGVAHLLEHMMFKGTGRVPAGARTPSPAPTTPRISSSCTYPSCRWR